MTSFVDGEVFESDVVVESEGESEEADEEADHKEGAGVDAVEAHLSEVGEDEAGFASGFGCADAGGCAEHDDACEQSEGGYESDMVQWVLW